MRAYKDFYRRLSYTEAILDGIKMRLRNDTARVLLYVMRIEKDRLIGYE